MKQVQVPKSYKYISGFLTLRCNLKCPYCINKFDPTFRREQVEELSGEKWVEGLNRLEIPNSLPVTFTGGEPSLHEDFVFIINNLRPDIPIDILTNLMWSQQKMEEFLAKVNPERLKRDAKYPSIRVSYHPTQQDIQELVRRAKIFQDAGFSIGIYSVLFPSPETLSAIYQAQFVCRNAGIDFRLKDFMGTYDGKEYGTYAYKNLRSQHARVLCKTSELLISPIGQIHRCHADLYAGRYPVAHIDDPELVIQDIRLLCTELDCNPCDVKLKTDYRQELGHTSVEITDIKEQ